MLGDFRILRELGRGGMGIVYEAEQLSLGRRVALKVLPFAAVMDHKQLQRFKNEATAAAHLDHPNIVHVYSVGSERGVHFYAMQFIDGQTLAEVVRELRRSDGMDEKIEDRGLKIEDRAVVATDKGLPPSSILHPPSSTSPLAALSTARSTNPKEYFRTVARLGIQAAEALDHAHQIGIIHRDIKPGNLMLDTRGNLWITDFGLARVGTDTNLTMTGDLVGTLRYMSPEQALAKRVVVDHRTDIYSLGVTLYELLTLQPAFAGEDRHELLRQIAFDEPRPPHRINDRIPPELETIVLKVIAKNPTERYASAQELAEDLERLLRDEPIRARRPTLVQRAWKWARRHKPLVWSAAACALIALAAVAGSIGWVRGDRAARLADVERQIELPLHEATRLMQQANWPDARAWLERAEGLLVGGGGREEVHRRVSAMRMDIDLIQRLEDARLEKSAVLDGDITYAEVDARYAQVFRDYGIDFDGLGTDEAADRIRQSAVCSELTAMIDDWAMVRRRAHGPDETSWKKLLAVAQAADSNELRSRMRLALEHREHGAVGELAASAEVATLPSPTVVLLAEALGDSGEIENAVQLLRTASRTNRGDFWISYTLTHSMHDVQPPRFEEMVQFGRVASALRPQSTAAARLFADALRHSGALDEAIAECHEAIRMKPDYPGTHIILGAALSDKDALDEAIAAFREAIRLKPEVAGAHNNLGNELLKKGALDEAIAEYREAIRLNPDYATAHNSLGHALANKGALDDAIAEFREAIRLKADYAWAHTNLGNALRNKGALDEAIAECREAIRLKPDFAEAHNKHQNAAAVRFYTEAFVAQPDLAADLSKQHRYNAVCAAALAGCGQGEDAGSIGDEERARLRQQALDWLRAELDSWRKLLEGDSADARAKVVETLKHWQTDSDLAGVRDAQALAKLPESECEAWGRLWGEVAEVLKESSRE